ncbi:MAG TPA: hypothetical protein VLX09_16040 [Stellaceae bacterium]|nr:hypothetical protein [Stellaceae bacterium]
MSQRGNKVFCDQISRLSIDRNSFRRTLHGSRTYRASGENGIRAGFDRRGSDFVGAIWCYAEFAHDLEVATLNESGAPQLVE